jgi:kynurenine formamidase
MSSLQDFAADLLAGKIRIVDLTQTLSPEFPTIVLPPQFGQCEPFKIEEVSRYDERGPAWYWNTISMNEHTGTHFDAPVHWVSGKDFPNNTTDTIPAEKMVAPAVVIDISADVAKNPDFLLTVEALQAWEAAHGRIPDGAWVLLRTDWSKKSGAAYANVQADGAHTPGPDVASIKWLVEERDVLGFGTETIGTDAGQAFAFQPPFPAHFFMHGKGRYGLQCLCNLDRLPPTGALVIAPPLKIKGGSGSPLRVLALAPT